jgi:hypothetical protein
MTNQDCEENVENSADQKVCQFLTYPKIWMNFAVNFPPALLFLQNFSVSNKLKDP